MNNIHNPPWIISLIAQPNICWWLKKKKALLNLRHCFTISVQKHTQCQCSRLIRSLQCLRYRLCNPLILSGLCLPHLPGFLRGTGKSEGRRRSPGLRQPWQNEPLHMKGTQSALSHAGSLHRWRCFGGRFMVAKHKAGCCDIAFFCATHETVVMLCDAECVHACLKHLRPA